MLHVSRRQRAVLAAFALVSASLTAAGPAVADGRPQTVRQLQARRRHLRGEPQLRQPVRAVGRRERPARHRPRRCDAAHTTQVSQAGNAYQCLKQLDVNLDTDAAGNTLSKVCNPETVTFPDNSTVSYTSHFPNAPFNIDQYIPADATTCPRPNQEFSFPNGIRNGALQADGVTPVGLPGGCTRDLVHKFYQEQYQLDGGRQDRYLTGQRLGRHDDGLLRHDPAADLPVPPRLRAPRTTSSPTGSSRAPTAARTSTTST